MGLYSFSSASPGTVDAFGSTYAIAALGTGTKSVGTNQQSIYIGLTNGLTKGGNDSIEGFTLFDFSTLPTGTINSASMSITVVANSSFGNDVNTNINVFGYDWGAGIDVTDYIAASATGSLPLYGVFTSIPDSGPTTYTISVSSQLISAIQTRSAIKMIFITDSTINYASNQRAIRNIATNLNPTTAYRPSITVSLTEASGGVQYNLIVSPL